MLIICSAVVGWNAIKDSVGPSKSAETVEGDGDEPHPSLEAKVGPAAAPTVVTEAGCEPGADLRTRALALGEAQGPEKGSTLRLTNMLGRPLFAELVDIKTQSVVQTLLVMPGDSIDDVARSPLMKLALQTGDVWCGMRSGWIDGKKMEVEEPFELMAGRSGTEVVYVSPARDGRLKIGRGFVGAEEVVANAEVEAAVAQLESEQLGLEQGESLVREGATDPDERATWSKRRDELEQLGAGSAAAAVRERQARRAQAEEVTGQLSTASRRLTVAKLRDQAGGLEIQDWRNLPSRDMRLMVRGRVRMIAGTVGDQEVTFMLSGSSMTTIGEDVAELAGSSGCLNPMAGQGVWKGCLQLVPRIGFGSAELYNVLVVVEPRVRVPILGADLVGRIRTYQGKDGVYLRVGSDR